MKSKQYHPQEIEKRKLIITATRILLNNSDCENLTIRTIANHLNCSGPFIYNYFENKNELLREVKRDAVSEILKVIQQAIDHTQLPEDQLWEIYQAYWKYANSEKYLFRLLFDKLNNEKVMGSEFCRMETQIFDLTSVPFHNYAIQKGQSKTACISGFNRYWALIKGLLSLNIHKEKLPENFNQNILQQGLRSLFPTFPP